MRFILFLILLVELGFSQQLTLTIENNNSSKGYLTNSINEANSTLKWTTPTNKEVIWKKAIQLCKENGARLPTKEELKKVVIACGGLFTTYRDVDWSSLTDKNKANKAYQSCYKQKGFNLKKYWTSSKNINVNMSAWIVDFSNGSQSYNFNTNSNIYVYCVKEEK